MIKINLVREGRAVRGTGVVAGPAVAAGPSSANNGLMIGGVILGILIAGGWWYTQKRTLAQRQESIAQKQVEATRLEKIIKDVADFQKQKDSLQKRIDLINQLKQNQRGPVLLMDRVSQDLPDLVWLDKMVVGGEVVTIDGRGLNPNAIANFVENVKNDPLFEEPDLGHVTQVSAAPLVYSYTMKFHFTYVPKGEAGTAGAATGTSTTGTSATAISGTATGTATAPSAVKR
ncbi:MAG: PilN domain-containing protein [Acidobacteria bacterium]|nr:PilN domain-containing protein [Acidobacteriota bacterium]MBV9186125.1 PilN domain-containing protein [Acidobacteriota bacterium]